ncbi:hypothetical protein LUZ60_013835 [Juncus effusus]|nr:hypothetical protein LUZ60_013835 [Juncus effusus]
MSVMASSWFSSVIQSASSTKIPSNGFVSNYISGRFLLSKPYPKKQKSQSQRAQIRAYYGLTTPPYNLDALEPYMSKKTVELHWGEHHKEYVEKLNKQLKNSEFYGYTLEETIKATYNNGNPLTEFNNASELWSHDFFWESMQPEGGDMPFGGVLSQIEKDFGSFVNFRDEFARAAVSLYGSGWVWLYVKRGERRLAVAKTHNAVSPLAWGDIPIIGLDLWEHAYYLDFKDDRAAYVNNFLDHLVSWQTVMVRMMRAEAFVNLGEPNVPDPKELVK